MENVVLKNGDDVRGVGSIITNDSVASSQSKKIRTSFFFPSLAGAAVKVLKSTNRKTPAEERRLLC